MIWVRAALLSVCVGLVVLALAQAQPRPAGQPVASASQDTTNPLPLATRVPLPTAQPQMIVSRVARETPLPRVTSTPTARPGVSIVDNGYLPAQQSVHLGDVVTWVNTGTEGHDVNGSGPGGAWHSGPLAPSERYERQFGLPGEYDFACSVHPEMRGRIVVQP